MVQLTGGIVDIEERCKWIAFWNESVSYLSWIAFIAVFSVHVKDLRNRREMKFPFLGLDIRHNHAIE